MYLRRYPYFCDRIGSTDLAAAWVRGKIWLRVPETIKATFNGIPKHPYTSAKDLVLYLIKEIGDDGATYQAIEYHGEAIENLTAEGKLTIANMAIEAGGKNAIFPWDKSIEEYEKTRAQRPVRPVETDPNAVFAVSIHGMLKISNRRSVIHICRQKPNRYLKRWKIKSRLIRFL